MSRFAGILTLIFVTLLWGSTFVVIKELLLVLSVPLLLALRFGLASVVLAWVKPERAALKAGLILGALSMVAYVTQSIGLTMTTASNSAFITGLNVIITPVIASIWFRKNLPVRVFLACAVAFVGLGFLTLGSTSGLNMGDVWTLGTALSYALYIIYLGEVANRFRALDLTALQIWSFALFAVLWALPSLTHIPSLSTQHWLMIVYLAVFPTVITSFLQAIAQRSVPAYLTALIFVFEPVFAAVFAYIMLHEMLGYYGVIGAGLVFIAMLISELRLPKRRALLNNEAR